MMRALRLAAALACAALAAALLAAAAARSVPLDPVERLGVLVTGLVLAGAAAGNGRELQ